MNSTLIIKDIPGYPGLKADSEGNIWGKRGRVLKRQHDTKGYPKVSVARNTKRSIHLLVCLAFHGPRPEGMVIRHLDGDKENSKPENLKYGTGRENADDTIRLGSIRGSNNCRSKLTEDDVVEMRVLYNQGVKQAELSKKYGVSGPCIFYALEGTRVWTHVPNPCKMRVRSYLRGSKASQAKLDEDKVKVIRKLIRRGETDINIAKVYGVTPGAIWNIRHGNTYRGVQ